MRAIKIILISALSLIIILILGIFFFLKFYKPSLSENYGNVDYHLYLSDSDNQPLIVAFGGGQGGNAWTEDSWMNISGENTSRE